MKENENKSNTTCDPCEERFENNIDSLVREGEAPNSQEREKKEEEVKAAFAEKEPAER